MEALRHVGQSTKQQTTNLNYQINNGVTTEKNNDNLLKQLLKNITTPQQLNGQIFS